MQVAALCISFRNFFLHADRSYFILLKSKADTRSGKQTFSLQNHENLAKLHFSKIALKHCIGLLVF